MWATLHPVVPTESPVVPLATNGSFVNNAMNGDFGHRLKNIELSPIMATINAIALVMYRKSNHWHQFCFCANVAKVSTKE